MVTLLKEWWVVDCPCPYDKCSSAVIEPDVTRYQGSIHREEAEHIVELHNKWVKEQQTCPPCPLCEPETYDG